MSMYKVTISPTGLNTTAPSDGFIDPIRPHGYHHYNEFTSSVAAPAVDDGTTFLLNGASITVSGTDAASIVAAINLKSHEHHFVASGAGPIVLTALPDYEYSYPTIVNVSDETFATRSGLNSFTVENLYDDFTTLDESVAKARGYHRWNFIKEHLSLSGNIDIVFQEMPDSTISAPPSEIIFFLTVDNLYTFTDFDGNIVYGESAIRHAIAKALMAEGNRLTVHYDPTANVNSIVVGETLSRIEIGALTDSEEDALAAVNVEAAFITGS